MLHKTALALVSICIFSATVMTLRFVQYPAGKTHTPTESVSLQPISSVKNARDEDTTALLSLDKKIGQVLMTTLSGPELTDGERQELRQGSLSNIILFSKNIKDAVQLKQLTGDIYREATRSGLVPFVAVDQEGGTVSRVPWIDTTAQADIATEDQAYNVAWLRGQQLKALGINMVLSPVVEPATRPDSFITRQKRGFATDSAKLAMAMVNGYLQAGIIPVVKHFPAGLGRVTTDPHQALPELAGDTDMVLEDLMPFAQILTTVPAVMVTHLVYSRLDASPSSSAAIFTDKILRSDLGFGGLLVSDDLSMAAVKDSYDVANYALGSLEAGVDLLIISSRADYDSTAIKLGQSCSKEACSKMLEGHVRQVVTQKRTLK